MAGDTQAKKNPKNLHVVTAETARGGICGEDQLQDEHDSNSQIFGDQP
jgi:hypothetical protein